MSDVGNNDSNLPGTIAAILVFVPLAAIAAASAPEPEALLLGALAIVAPLLLRRWVTRRQRRRRTLLSQPFPSEHEAVLQRDVAFYRVLAEEDRLRFRQQVTIFLDEKRITGIRCEIDVTVRVLTAASAVIPIFGFPRWEWDQIGEVLIYPGAFDESYGGGEHAHAIGMVGTGPMERTMILSKPHLLSGFQDPKDKSNVGIHEFAHLVDKSDGVIDGVPAMALPRDAMEPWMEMIRSKTAQMHGSGEADDIPDYAATNPAEFFAVLSEYFFERPHLLEQRHPKLYDTLQRIFRQDMRHRFRDAVKALWSPYPKKIGRNAPCPCGSGKKYKRCCLR